MCPLQEDTQSTRFCRAGHFITPSLRSHPGWSARRHVRVLAGCPSSRRGLLALDATTIIIPATAVISCACHNIRPDICWRILSFWRPNRRDATHVWLPISRSTSLNPTSGKPPTSCAGRWMPPTSRPTSSRCCSSSASRDVYDEEYAGSAGGIRRRRGIRPVPAELPLPDSRRTATGTMCAPSPPTSARRCRRPCAASRRPTRRPSTASSATRSGPTRTACPIPCSAT